MSQGREARSIVHVVAGLLTQDGRLCITRRHRNSHQGGKWEFPGGKLESGEDRLTGLKRELHEELFIEVQAAEPFMQVRHAYPEFEVLLDVWRVTHYTGTPHGREGQDMRWAEIAQLNSSEFPEADRPILRRLQLPPLYVISDVHRFGEDEFARRLERALKAGVRLFQLREPQMGRDAYCSYARKLAALCRAAGARFIVNADPSWVDDCEADGVHLTSARLMSAADRPLPMRYWTGASCHNAEELARAVRLNLDFAVLGPVQPTASHPGAAVLGWARFAELAQAHDIPAYAIGGMAANNLPQAIAHGATGVAMISGIWNADDLEATVRRLSPPD